MLNLEEEEEEEEEEQTHLLSCRQNSPHGKLHYRMSPLNLRMVGMAPPHPYLWIQK